MADFSRFTSSFEKHPVLWNFVFPFAVVLVILWVGGYFYFELSVRFLLVVTLWTLVLGPPVAWLRFKAHQMKRRR